jgi:hypothetical protein
MCLLSAQALAGSQVSRAHLGYFEIVRDFVIFERRELQQVSTEFNKQAANASTSFVRGQAFAFSSR